MEALDLPRREFAREEEFELREHDLDLDKRGRRPERRGKRFEDEVAALYRLPGFEVKQDIQLNGVQIDLAIEQKLGGVNVQAIVECKETPHHRRGATLPGKTVPGDTVKSYQPPQST